MGNNVLDVTAGSVTVSAFLGWLPAAAAILTIIYTAIRVYETDTVQKIVAAISKKLKK
tara:strand:- start:260 stop:433 length:174 start_codon:yes stop_codon:yes gene_type:complete